MPESDSLSLRLVHLRAAGVSLLLDVRDAEMPAVVHWGGDLGTLTAVDAVNLAEADVPVIGPNCVGEPVRVTLPLQARGGFTGRPGLSGSRAGASWSPAFETRTVTFASPGHSPAAVTDFLEEGPGSLEVTMADAESALDLTLTVELTASGVVRTRAEVTNRGEDAYTVDDLVLALPVPERAGEILDFAGRWGKERVPQRSSFTVGTHLREGRRGRTGADAATLLHAGTRGFSFADGEVWAVHVGWSGNHTHYAELTFDGTRVIGGGELLLPGEVVLSSDESYTSPWVYAAHGIGLDQVAHRFHDWLRARPNPVSTHRPVTLNVWEAVYFDHDLERLLALAERAASIGVERFVLDDGWFGSRRNDTKGLGDWVVSPEAWPDGLGPLVNRVRELGMQFGLWFEPEMVNPDSETARAHPEWIMAARSSRPVESRFQQVLNLSIPECFEQILGQISSLVAEYGIDYIKWDHNRDLVEAGDQTRGGKPAVHAQTTATYALMAELKRRHPSLEIESCSSGGARVDLGVLEHTDRVWVSDNIDPLERQSMLRWTTQLLPPEYLGSHIASGRSHTTGRTHDLNFRAATAIFGHLGIEWDLTQAGDRAMEELRAWLDFYKDHRDWLLAGRLVRVDDPGDGFFVHGVVSQDQTRALFAVVTVAAPLFDPGPRFRFRGLDPATRYRVRPVQVGAAPSGLEPPVWWGGGISRVALPPDYSHTGGPQLLPARTYPGECFTGRSLELVGLRPPRVHPDQVVLYEVSVDAGSPGTEETR